MSELSIRIRRVTQDLQAIQDELNAAAQANAAESERERIMEELLNVKLVDEFKAAVDNMRHLLWSYIEASTGKSARGVTQTLQTVRMQRVTDMLRILQPNMEEAKIAATPEAQSLFEVIQKIAHTTVDRMQSDATAAKPAARNTNVR